MTHLVPVPSPGETLHFGRAGHPLVVVLHDWYGRLPWLTPYAEALASRGFQVALPDLSGGVCTMDAATAEQLMQQLDVGASLAIIDEVIEFVRLDGTVRVGTVGFSLGGWLALLHAQGGSVDAVTAYYATLGEDDHGVIPSPVQLHLAETDEWDGSDEPPRFIERLTEHGTPVSDHTYLGTVHSFANATMTATVDTRAAALAFARTVGFLQGHLLD